jgi:hypothetical protein
MQSSLLKFLEDLYSNRQKSTTKATPADEEKADSDENASQVGDAASPSGTMPVSWIPGGKHAWLLFICYGAFGADVFEMRDLPRLLRKNTAGSSDAERHGRREFKEPSEGRKRGESTQGIKKQVGAMIGKVQRKAELDAFDDNHRAEIKALDERIEAVKILKAEIAVAVRYCEPEDPRRADYEKEIMKLAFEPVTLARKRNELADRYTIDRKKFQQDLMDPN